MATVRFLQTGDWQLGMTRHFLRGEAQPRYSAARLDAIRALGRVAAQEDCEFVVVAGDVFESNLVGSRTIRRALEAMASIGRPVYLLPGNHDAHDAASVYRNPVFTAACPGNVVVLSAPGPVRVAAGVDIVAAPWPTRPVLTDLANEALAALQADGTLRVLLAHGALDVLDPDGGDVAAIRLAALEAALDRGTVHHVALGDRHSRLSAGRSGRVHYAGTPEVTSFREALPGDVLVVDIDTEGRHEVRHHHVGTWRFETLAHDIVDERDIAALDARLSAFAMKDRTVVRTALSGAVTLAAKARLDAVLAAHADSFAALFPWEGHDDVAVVVDDDQLADLGVGGFVGGAATELAQLAAAGGAPAADARAALSLLYRLAAGAAR